jgi:cytidylate kinase
MILIGISGKIGSGKDTLADFIMKHAPFEKKSFAEKIKKTGAYLTGTAVELWYTQEGKNVFLPEWDMTIGEFQQKLGTDAARVGLHDKTWIISLFADLKPTSQWLIKDLRFKNEAYAIKERDGIVLRINGDPAKIRENSKRDLTHISETDLDDFSEWDGVYSNVGSLENLETYAKLVLAKWT